MPTLVKRPDRRPPNRWRTVRIFLAVVGALLLHLLVLLAVVWIVPHWPRGKLHAKPRPIELTIVPPKGPEPSGPVDAKGTPPPYIRTLDDQAADHAPDDPAFISSQDTLAASQRPADGNKPLPSTDGKEMPSFDFEPRPYRLDTHAADAATSAPSAPEAAPAPSSTPAPVSKKPLLPAKGRAPRKASAQATPSTSGELASPNVDPSPEPPVPTPADTPQDQDSSAPPPPSRQSNQQKTTNAPPANVTSNGAPKPPGYQPMSIATKMTGSINNRGRSAVAAIGTPLGRYEKAVSDAIGMLWYYKTEQDAADVAPGSVKIHFYVDREGRVKNVKFTGGNSNGTLGLISEQAVSEAQIEPMPPDVANNLDAGQLEVEYSFSMYSF